MSEHTEGPWRWEFNAKSKSVHLVGGRPQFDLTVIDFVRWGMVGSVPRFRELSEREMNLMHRLCDRPEWIAPLPFREHHADWCAGVTHADARLIEAAPELLEALRRAKAVIEAAGYPVDTSITNAIAKATGEQP